jgi:hypothetical protein
MATIAPWCKTSARMTARNALSEEARHTKMQEGIAAWKAWVEKHHAAIVGMGGTKKVSDIVRAHDVSFFLRPFSAASTVEQLFDHLVGAHHDRLRKCKTKLLHRLLVDHHLKNWLAVQPAGRPALRP